MTGSRDKSTISQGKDPLDNVTYRQEHIPPINGLIADTSREAKAEPEGGRQTAPSPKEVAATEARGKVTVALPMDLLERLRNAAWWQRKTLATLAEEGIELVVEKLERQHGGTFEPRGEELKPGRPQGSKSQTSKPREHGRNTEKQKRGNYGK
jgi:hypothetical protein